jgi:hypothetical protein
VRYCKLLKPEIRYLLSFKIFSLQPVFGPLSPLCQISGSNPYWDFFRHRFFIQSAASLHLPFYNIFPKVFYFFFGWCVFHISVLLSKKTEEFILKLNQQDATLYNIRLLFSVLYMFRGVFPLIIRSSKTVHAASGTCQTCLLWPLAWVSRFHSPMLAVTSNKFDKYRRCMYSFWAPDDERKNARNMSERLTHASGHNIQVWQVPDAACTVLELLMMSEKTLEICTALTTINEYCITLHLVGSA